MSRQPGAVVGAQRRLKLLAGPFARYGGAVALVAGAFLLRQEILAASCPRPLYITFVPMLMVVALLWGLRAGLLATGLAAILAWYWIFPPVGRFRIEGSSDLVGLVLFTGTGIFISVVAGLYQRARQRAASLENEAKYRLLFHNMLDGFAHCRMLFDEGGRPIDLVYLDVNESFASGYEVAVAFDGSQGIEKAHEFKPDVVFCDIGLPGMDAYEVAQAFRRDAALRGVFLAALTGYSAPEDQQRAAEAGFARHLAKPASLQMLEEVIASLRS